MAVQPATRRFTVDEYHRMGEAGILFPDERVELLEGEVVEMSPIGSRHAACVRTLNAVLGERLWGRAIVAVHDPVRLGKYSEPQPDLALLAPRDDRYATEHPGPGDALLVVEVADTTTLSDRNGKIPLYARAGVTEAWLVDLPAGAVEVYRSPEAGAYRDVHRAGPDDAVSPLAFPDVHVPLRDVLR
jgi:Uma2 family endonuclease